MIRFSKREDYAVVLIDELVKEYKKRLVPLSEVSKKHNIPLLFLRNIANTLRRTGIVEAVEGKYGGYKLARHPSQMQVGDVLKALSSEPLFSCCQNTIDGKCHVKLCPHGFSLRRLTNKFVQSVSSISLETFSKQDNI